MLPVIMDDREYQDGLKQILDSGEFGAVMSREVSIEDLSVFSEEEGFFGGRKLGVRLYNKIWQYSKCERFTNAYVLNFFYLLEHSRNRHGNMVFSRVAKSGYGPAQHKLLQHYVNKRIFGKG